MNLNFKLVNTSEDFKDIEIVWRLCNWGWNDKGPERMKSIFDNRWKNIIAYLDDHPVGYAGLISDHNVYALIVDMMVAPDYQKKGIGKSLMTKIIKECKENDIKVIKLISSENGKKLYESFDFDICPNEAPGMMLKLYEKMK